MKEEPTVVDPTMDALEWLRKQLDEGCPDLVRALLERFAGDLMSAEADARPSGWTATAVWVRLCASIPMITNPPDGSCSRFCWCGRPTCTPEWVGAQAPLKPRRTYVASEGARFRSRPRMAGQ
jgi:hypothetical protein